jgi:hypothetical protein
MSLLLGIGGILTWIIADIWLGIKINKTNNTALKSLLIAVNVVIIIFAIMLFYTQ